MSDAPSHGTGQLRIHLQWALLLGSALVAAVYLAWSILARVDFLYPQAYDLLGIDQAIATYGPQNRLRRGFERTNRAERIGLFAQIVAAVFDDSGDLGQIVYHDADGAPIGRLLTRPEIVHLEDVARLVHVIDWIGAGAVGLWLTLLVLARWQRLPRPSMRRHGLAGGLVLTAVAAGVWLIGPERVFYRMHGWIFPEGHRWFFYYQESLMTLLMKAPDLFGVIALEIIALAALCYVGLLLVTGRVVRSVRRRASRP